MAGEEGDKVGIFNLPIDVSCEGATCQVTARDFVQRMLDFLTRNRVQLRYQAGYVGHFEGGLDIVVVILLADEGQQLVARNVLVLLHDFQGDRVEGDNNCSAAEVKRLGSDVFQGAVLDGLFSIGLYIVK